MLVKKEEEGMQLGENLEFGSVKNVFKSTASKVKRGVKKGVNKVKDAGNPLMILKDLLTKLAPKLIKHVRSIAPSPRSVDVLIGCKDCPNVGNKPPPFVQEIVDKIFDSKQRHTLAIPIKQAMGLFIVQNILDVATCLRNPTGNGDTTLSMLRGFCLAFSPVLASHSPTVFTKSYETSANTCTNCTGAETSAPTALVLKFKKCGSISKQTWKMQNEPGSLQICAAQKPNKLGIYQVREDCFEQCDHGVEAVCQARAVWKYKQCSTCCCKGGTGFQASFKMDLDVEADTVYKGIVLERNAKCGLWFQTIEAFVALVSNLLAKLDTALSWGTRCVKF